MVPVPQLRAPAAVPRLLHLADAVQEIKSIEQAGLSTPPDREECVPSHLLRRLHVSCPPPHSAR